MHTIPTTFIFKKIVSLTKTNEQIVWKEIQTPAQQIKHSHTHTHTYQPILWYSVICKQNCCVLLGDFYLSKEENAEISKYI